MRAVVQRVREAAVSVDGETVGSIGLGLCCLVGVETDDGEDDVVCIARKLAGLRIFDDEEGVMNRSVTEAGGGILLVSQFTLLGDARKGRRPSYSRAEKPERARELLTRLQRMLAESTGIPVATGEFQTEMDVHLTNHGPVTILLDSKKKF